MNSGMFDAQYTKVELRKYQSIVKKDKSLATAEQRWVDLNLQPVTEFMGDSSVWEFLIPDIVLKEGSSRGIPYNGRPTAVFSGAHWTSRRPNDTKFFDPYSKYQIFGTNQFCQTYALMYLMDILPDSRSTDFRKYYDYTRAAIEFIKTVIVSIPPSNHAFHEIKKASMLTKINNCLEHSNMCLNVIELPGRNLS